MNNLNAGSSSFTERARSMLFPATKGGNFRGRSPVPSGSRSVDLYASPSESDRLANQKKEEGRVGLIPNAQAVCVLGHIICITKNPIMMMYLFLSIGR